MPNFDCDGGGCGGMLCLSCTPDKLREIYHEQVIALADEYKPRITMVPFGSGGHSVDVDMNAPPEGEAERRARAIWKRRGSERGDQDPKSEMEDR